MKKILTRFMALVLLTAVLPMTALAEGWRLFTTGKQEADGLSQVLEETLPDMLEDVDIEINVEYMSPEYLQEMEGNSLENIYFGYKLSELDEQFEGKRYYFLPDEEGNTIVRELNEADTGYERVLISDSMLKTGCFIISCVLKSNKNGMDLSMLINISRRMLGMVNEDEIPKLIAGLIRSAQSGDFDIVTAGINLATEWAAVVVK